MPLILPFPLVLTNVNDSQKQFLDITSKAAEDAGHLFPSMAACEAALESGYGSSELAVQGHNLFGVKQHIHARFGTLNLPTKEFLNGNWTVVDAAWVSYPTLTDCFRDRLATLQLLAPHYPHYAAALGAPDAQTFVTEVSKSWSTDPQRAAKVIQIFDKYLSLGGSR